MSSVKTVNLLYTEPVKSKFYNEDKPFGYEGGTFPEKDVDEAIRLGIPLTLDLSIPGECYNNCMFCGYYDVNKEGKLDRKEIFKIIRDFAALGGKSVKILGEGEPLLRADIIEILAFIKYNRMVPVLFASGDVIGDDRLSKKVHGIYGGELVERLGDIGVTVMLKFEGWEQDEVVGRRGFSKARNRALSYLLYYGFNEHYPTKLGFGTVLLKSNYEDIAPLFEYCLRENIYQLICPLMPIGKMEDEKERKRLAPSKKDVAVLKGRLKTIRTEFGVSPSVESDFPGGLPCDIARAGFYVDDVGNVYLCESDMRIGNVRTSNITTNWRVIDRLKTGKYGEKRRCGLCFPKRMIGVV